MPDREPKKRGRPANYNDKKAKAEAEVQRKRQKRQAKTAQQRAQQHDQFYGVTAPSTIPSLPPAHSNHLRTNDLPPNDLAPVTTLSQDIDDDNNLGFDDFDLSFHLPPPTPPLDPNSEDIRQHDDNIPPTSLSPPRVVSRQG